MAFVLKNQRTKILELEEIETDCDSGYRYFKNMRNFRNVSKINILDY